jgi:hypothetical protein
LRHISRLCSTINTAWWNWESFSYAVSLHSTSNIHARLVLNVSLIS